MSSVVATCKQQEAALHMQSLVRAHAVYFHRSMRQLQSRIAHEGLHFLREWAVPGCLGSPRQGGGVVKQQQLCPRRAGAHSCTEDAQDSTGKPDEAQEGSSTPAPVSEAVAGCTSAVAAAWPPAARPVEGSVPWPRPAPSAGEASWISSVSGPFVAVCDEALAAWQDHARCLGDELSAARWEAHESRQALILRRAEVEALTESRCSAEQLTRSEATRLLHQEADHAAGELEELRKRFRRDMQCHAAACEEQLRLREQEMDARLHAVGAASGAELQDLQRDASKAALVEESVSGSWDLLTVELQSELIVAQQCMGISLEELQEVESQCKMAEKGARQSFQSAQLAEERLAEAAAPRCRSVESKERMRDSRRRHHGELAKRQRQYMADVAFWEASTQSSLEGLSVELSEESGLALTHHAELDASAAELSVRAAAALIACWP